MHENFSKAMAFVLEYEGQDYVDDPRDPGGPTRFGITIATLSHELGRRATRTEVRNMPLPIAYHIYQKKFWNAIGGDDLASGVDLSLFDVSVNMGVGRAIQFLDETHGLAPNDRIRAIDKLRVGFWRHLRTFPYFGTGWLKRETACLAVALALAGNPPLAPGERTA